MDRAAPFAPLSPTRGISRARKPALFALSTLFLAVPVLQACPSSTAEKKSDAAPTPTSTAVEVDPQQLCNVYADVLSARYTGRLAAAHDQYAAVPKAKTSASRAAVFGEILTLPTLKRSWEGFRDENLANSGTVLFPLGECLVYADWKMDDQAPPRCDAAKEKLEGLALADVGLATLWLAKGQLDVATAAAEKAIATDAKCAPAHVVKAQILAAKNDTAGAIAVYGDALKAKPDCFACAAERAILVEQQGDVEASAAAWEAALEIIGDHAQSLERYASVQVGRDDAKAFAAYEQAISKGKPSYSTLFAAAQLAARTKALLKAIDYGERAARLEPDHVDQWRLLAQLYAERNENEAIEKANDEILRLVPDDREAHLALARLADKSERFVDAIEHFDAAMATFEGESAEAPSPEVLAALTAEQAALRQKLHIGDPVSGTPEVIQDRVRRTVQGLFESRHKGGTKGKIVVTVKTFKEGGVEEANVLEDTLKDPYVTASLLGNLKRSNISGGRKLYEFEYAFQ